ncbi:hypothetical protein HHK36_014087 [Tetracentron sinense]|uniref:Transcription repressor n=1 Tax=Tetracentron sinense TaxID=13715 RepID=A0A834Z7J8_TETSI|nr:hypothetical protein HHK36_014087 [Tetracentron sinense]
MFRASFGSCQSRNVLDDIEKPVSAAQTRRDFRLIRSLPLKERIFPSICRPRWPETMEVVGKDCIVAKKKLQRRKVSDQSLFFVSGDPCPPASPISPLNSFYKERKKKSKKNKKKESCRFSSSSAETNGGLFSSENGIEDETETFFSSKSFSSDYSESHRRKISGTHRRRDVRRNLEMGSKGKFEDSFAVVKHSSDPYRDFRTSMVEMIIEKQIFAAKELEHLLQCFLSLNSSHHHKIIVEVFSEILEALFSIGFAILGFPSSSSSLIF